MTNLEKYKDDLMKIGREFAFNKNTREIVRCGSCINCTDCIFNGNCFENEIEWLCKEYKEPILSDDELDLIKAISKATNKEYKYVTRDVYDIIRLFEIKPSVNKSGNYYGEYTYSMSGSEILFSNITHKDGLYDIENKCFIKEGDD